MRDARVGAALVWRVVQRAERLERDGIDLARERAGPPARASITRAGLGGRRLLLLPRRARRLLLSRPLPVGHRGDTGVLRVLLGELEASLRLVRARGTLHGRCQHAALVEALLWPSPRHGGSDGFPAGGVLHRRWVLAQRRLEQLLLLPRPLCRRHYRVASRVRVLAGRVDTCTRSRGSFREV